MVDLSVEIAGLRLEEPAGGGFGLDWTHLMRIKKAEEANCGASNDQAIVLEEGDNTREAFPSQLFFTGGARFSSSGQEGDEDTDYCQCLWAGETRTGGWVFSLNAKRQAPMPWS